MKLSNFKFWRLKIRWKNGRKHGILGKCFVVISFLSVILVCCSLSFISLKDLPHNISSGTIMSHSQFHSNENYAMTEGVVQVGPFTGITLSMHWTGILFCVCSSHKYKQWLSMLQLTSLFAHKRMCLHKITYRLAICSEMDKMLII